MHGFHTFYRSVSLYQDQKLGRVWRLIKLHKRQPGESAIALAPSTPNWFIVKSRKVRTALTFSHAISASAIAMAPSGPMLLPYKSRGVWSGPY